MKKMHSKVNKFSLADKGSQIISFILHRGKKIPKNLIYYIQYLKTNFPFEGI